MTLPVWCLEQERNTRVGPEAAPVPFPNGPSVIFQSWILKGHVGTDLTHQTCVTCTHHHQAWQKYHTHSTTHKPTHHSQTSPSPHSDSSLTQVQERKRCSKSLGTYRFCNLSWAFPEILLPQSISSMGQSGQPMLPRVLGMKLNIFEPVRAREK